MVVAWGPEFRFFCNDRYRPVLGTKHPAQRSASRAREIFPEVWSVVGPEFERVRRGEAFAHRRLAAAARSKRLPGELLVHAVSYARSAMKPAASADCSPSSPETAGRVGRRAAAGDACASLARRAADAHDARSMRARNAGAGVRREIRSTCRSRRCLSPRRDAASPRGACASVGIASDHPTCTEVVAIARAVRRDDAMWQLGEVVRTGRAIVSANLIDRVGPSRSPGGPCDEFRRTRSSCCR